MKLALTQPMSYTKFRLSIARLAHEKYDGRTDKLGPFTAGYLGLYTGTIPEELAQLLPKAITDRLLESDDAQTEFSVLNGFLLFDEYARRKTRTRRLFTLPILFAFFVYALVIFEIWRYERREQAALEKAAKCAQLLQEYDRASDFLQDTVVGLLKEARCSVPPREGPGINSKAHDD